jgi:hypothetical protein
MTAMAQKSPFQFEIREGETAQQAYRRWEDDEQAREVSRAYRESQERWALFSANHPIVASVVDAVSGAFDKFLRRVRVRSN